MGSSAETGESPQPSAARESVGCLVCFVVVVVVVVVLSQSGADDANTLRPPSLGTHAAFRFHLKSEIRTGR